MNPPLSGTYSPSGRFSILILLWVPLLTVPAAVVLGIAYAYAILYIPLVYVSFLLTLGFGALMGLAAAKGNALGKGRAPWLAGVLGLGAGLLALTLHWVVWIQAFFTRGGGDVPALGLALDPGLLWKAICTVNVDGAWSIKGSTPTGAFLWVVWAVEALTIVLLPALMAMSSAAAPFCEECGAWCKRLEGVFVGKDAPPDELLPRLRAQDIGYIGRLGPAEAGAETRIRYDLHPCGCGATCTMKATAITRKVVKGKEKETEADLVGHVLLRRDAVAALKALGERPEAPAAAAG